MGIGYRIKEAREKAGLTQEELGNKIGVTGSAITNYEKETSHPKEPIMYALIDALGVSPNYLFQDCVSTIKQPADGGGLRDDESKLLALYNGLNEEGQERLFRYAEDLNDTGKYIKNQAAVMDA